MSQDKRFTRGERFFISLGILVPSLLLTGVVIDRKLNTVPDFVPPPQRVATPNAMETLRSAYAMRVTNGTNSNVHFDKMLKLPLEDRQKSLEANQKAIARIREALKQGYATPIDWNNPAAQTFPQYAEQRELARLLAFAARTYADIGDRKEALRCAIDAIELGVKSSVDGPLIGYLVGMACEAIGRRVLWEQLDSLTPAEAKEVLARLDRLETQRAPFKNFLVVERGYLHKVISDLAHRKITPSDFATSVYGLTAEDKQAQTRMMLGLAFTDKGAAWKAGDAYYDALNAYWSHPYKRGGPPKPPTDMINQILMPVFDQASFSFARNQTDDALLRGCLKLKAEGRSESFEAPADPFNQNQPLHYKKTPDGYRLWSVGPDGVDNAGAAIISKHDNHSVYEADQNGDVVARINTF